MLLCMLTADAFGQDDDLLFPESRHSLYKLVCLGNMTGLAIGLHYAPAAWIGFEGMAGFQLPYSAFWASPYRSNQVAVNLRLRLMHPWGFYAVAGWFTGAYEINIESFDLNESSIIFVQAPVAAIGYSWPPQPTDVQLSIEVGGAFGLPKRRSIETTDSLALYRLTTRRSSSSTGNLMPFFTIFFQL